MKRTVSDNRKEKSVFLVAPTGLCSSGPGYARAFHSLGWRVILFNTREYLPLSTSPLCGLRNRLERRRQGRDFNRELQSSLLRLKPSLLVVAKGNRISTEVLCRLKEELQETVFVNINHDDYYSSAPGNIFPDLKRLIPAYDYFFPTKKCNVDELLKEGARNAHYLPFGYDPCLYFPVKPTGREFRRYHSSLVFIGNYEKERGEFLAELAAYRPAIWGTGWLGRGAPAGTKRFVRVSSCLSNPDLEFSKIVNSCPISLNFFRKENRDSLNPRVFEVAACGGFVLSQRSDELADYFEEGREIVTFSSKEELREKADYYLGREDQRRRIAEAGRERVASSPYSIRDRVKELLAVCGWSAGR